MAKAAKSYKSYKQMSEKLADIMAWFEADDIDLDEAVLKYQEAVKLLENMEQYLKTAENKIKNVTVKK